MDVNLQKQTNNQYVRNQKPGVSYLDEDNTLIIRNVTQKQLSDTLNNFHQYTHIQELVINLDTQRSAIDSQMVKNLRQFKNLTKLTVSPCWDTSKETVKDIVDNTNEGLQRLDLQYCWSVDNELSWKSNKEVQEYQNL